MQHYAFRKLRSSSLYACATECLVSSVCLSFGYQQDSGVCLLNSNSSKHVSVVTRSNFIFSDIEQWQKTLPGKCAVESCPETSTCRTDRYGRASCVKEFRGCGTPPEVTGARRKYQYHYEGAVATYSCRKDFLPCYKKTTSSCQSSGHWENMAGLCAQCRWHNPALGKGYVLPCGPLRSFKATFIVKPTGPTRFFAQVKKGKDIPFHCDFRFNYHQHSNMIAINTEFQGHIGSQLYLPHIPLAVGRESEIQVELHRGVYQLIVDGHNTFNFTERVRGVRPDHVLITGDVLVSMIEVNL
ncbi:uncharacterized protein [Haliotis asinina]|uniref:uncharacterized protein n=1 Tax=Haliotis asinina TaxID=109174 RepID=UPI003532244A